MKFQYPLDIKNILRKKNSLKKDLLQNNNLIEKNIAILGGSTTSEIKNILELFLLDSGIKPNFYESEYNKFYEDSLFENTLLESFKPEIIYIHTTNLNILEYPNLNDNNEEIEALLKNEKERFRSIWDSLSKYNCSIIQNNFDLTVERYLGNLDCYDIHGKTYFISKLNQYFSDCARDINNLFINDINYLSAYLGLKNWFDESLWYQAKYALSMEAIPELAFNISKIINAIFGNTKKCLILDLDNTCWGGVIGDDGLDGIHIGNETAISETYTAFQKYLKLLHKRGVTLAVCSKNDFKNAKEGFTHPDSVLRFDDFTVFKANWSNKNQNIIDIASELNIGLNALVFIDDNPFERNLVSSQLPEVIVPNVGSDVIDFINHIDKNGFFEPITIEKDDINRSKYYEDNKKRASDEATFISYEDFLISLKMTAEIQSFNPIYLERITQLTNKTNQFNLTTKRYAISEIEHISKNKNYIKIYGKLSDKHGDNGIVAVTIGNLRKGKCHIDLWLMSCRVLKRDFENAMLDELIKQSKEKGISVIIGYYFKSEKNNMVSELYKNFGFKLVESNSAKSIWELDIKNYKNKNKVIRVTNE